MNTRLVLLIAASLAAARAGAAVPEPVAELQDAWAKARYETADDTREAAFESLATRAADLRKANPDDVGVMIWEGIVLSTWAGEKGGLGALKLCKQARTDFEQAIAKDPRALEGSAYTSLGSLYYQVPGWPVGFGDDDRARELLEKALAINPDGIDPNYFYGDFLLEEKDYAGAARALEKALAAPARPGRELADRGRRDEAQAKLEEARRHLSP